MRLIIANSFVKNPDPKKLKCIININGDREHNRATNLKWFSQKENTAHIKKYPQDISKREDKICDGDY